MALSPSYDIYVPTCVRTSDSQAIDSLRSRLAEELGQRRAAGAQTYLSRSCPDGVEAFTAPAEAALAELRVRFGALDRGTRGALLPLATVPPRLRGVASQNQQNDAINSRMSEFARARHILWVHWRGGL